MRNLLPALYRRFAGSFLHFFLFFYLLSPVHGQTSDQICSLFRVAQSNGQPGDTVWLEVRGNIPDGLAAVQFAMLWNPGQLSFGALKLNNSALPFMHISNFNPADPGQILFSWYDLNAAGISISGDVLLFEAGFVVQPGAGNFSPVIIGSTPHLKFEAIALPVELYLPKNCGYGGIYNSATPVNSPVITQICTNAAGCNASGAFGLADITVVGGAPPYQFQWTRQGVAIGTAEDLNNVPSGQYSVIVTDQNGYTTEAAAEIASTQYDINVLTVVTNDNCQKNQGRIDLTVTGGYPPYSYNWSTGNAATASLTGLPAGYYMVTVTDAVGCSALAGNYISSYSNLYIDALIDKPSCSNPQAPGLITMFVQNGKPPYTYAWNVAGASGPILGIPESGIYSVTVSDANGCTSVQTFTVDDLETDSWTVFQNTFCDPNDGPGQILLFIDGGNDLNWPLTTHWSTSVTHTLNGSPNFSVLDSLPGLPDGTYSVTLEDAAGCRKSIGDIKTNCETQLAYDGKSCFQLRIGSTSAQAGETVCIPITADKFIGIGRIESTIQWDTAVMQYQGIHSIGLPSAPALQLYANNIARIKWSLPDNFPADGLSLPDGAALFELCFQIKPNAVPGSSAIGFGPDYHGAGTFQIKTFDPFILGIIGFEGEIQVGGPLTDRLHLNACATLPTCATDVHTDYTLEVSNGTPPFTLHWNAGGVTYTGTPDDLKYLNAGAYYVTVSDQNGKTATAALNQFAGHGPDACVWPGDADNNNAVNQYDLLYLGYGYGSSDLPRIEQGIDWQGYLHYFGWNQSTPVRQVDFSNMDCDGNGRVEQADIDILLQHWGRVVRPGIDDPYQAPPLPEDVNSAVFDVFVQPDTTHSDSLNLALQVGTSDNPASGINGIAFSIYYDTAAIEAGALQFVPTASWLGHPDSTLIWVQKNFPDQGRLDIAISRKGIQPQNGFGPVGELHGLLSDDMFRPVFSEADGISGDDSMRVTMLRIDHLVAMSDQENALASNGLETPVVIVQEVITNTNQPGNGQIQAQIRPNPARQFATVYCTTAPIEQIEVTTMNGTVLYTRAGAGSNTLRIDTAQIPSGFYWARVQTASGSNCIKFVVQH